MVSNYELVWQCIFQYLNGNLPEETILALRAANNTIVELPDGFSERLHARIEASLRNSATDFGN